VNSGPGLNLDKRAMRSESERRRLSKTAAGPLRLAFLLICLFLSFFSSGCVKEVTIYEPADMPVSLVVEQLEQRQNHLFSFRAVGTIRVRGGKQRWSGKAFLLSEFPDSLRLEVIGLFGNPLLYAVSDGHQFTIWDPGRDQAYQGLASSGTLARLIKFPLQDREALLLLAGIVPPWHRVQAKLFRLRNAESFVLQLENKPARLRQRIWLEGEDLIVTRVERVQDNEGKFEATFSDFVTIDGSFYPRSVVMEGNQAHISIRYQQIAVNEDLDARVFHLALPEGIEIVPW
jgi:outer membrane lipoprotein-sorting protein